ncbi:MAG: TauD/TfdA family dioxygenase [Gammaproteobacteria bacterium]|nr:TauD/TfdA family dioxygenase [Gammaproteobacteria bacterium]
MELANMPGYTASSRSALAMKTAGGIAQSPFSLENPDVYTQWRAWKLDQFAAYANCSPVAIKNPQSLTLTERTALLRQLRATNLSIYESGDAKSFSKQDLRLFAMQLGLNRLDGHRYAGDDGIACIQVTDEPLRQRYIPYTNKAINWHTDGYYNPPQRTIRAFIMHCVQPAKSGGENYLLDPEMVYISLRDQSPDLLDALFDTTAMSIPPNRENGDLVREQQNGPVFSIDTPSGSLHMRYTARLNNIAWKDSAKTQEALVALKQSIDECQQYKIQRKLQVGQGILCNNVLHTRAAFEDHSNPKSKRLLYRARFYDRIIGTGVAEFDGFMTSMM